MCGLTKTNPWLTALAWLGRTAATVIPVVVGVVVLVFFLLRMVPGDPAQMILGDQATDESLIALRAQLGLDLPVAEQFKAFLHTLITQGDTGNSLITGESSRDLILGRAHITLLLVGMAIVFTLLMVVPLALAAAMNKNTWIDHVVRIIPSVGLAMPAFWLGLLLIVFFGVLLGWLPVGGIGTGAGEPFRSLLLPAFTVALGLTPPLIRSLRAELLEVVESDFVTTLRAAQVPTHRIIFRHILRNALPPTVSLFGVNIAYLIGGTIVIEKVFAINGIGALLFNSISTRDFPVVQGITLFCAIFVVLIGIIVDLLVIRIDPRVRAA